MGATGGVVAGAKPLSVLGAGRADAEATVHSSVARTAAAIRKVLRRRVIAGLLGGDQTGGPKRRLAAQG